MDVVTHVDVCRLMDNRNIPVELKDRPRVQVVMKVAAKLHTAHGSAMQMREVVVDRLVQAIIGNQPEFY